MFSKLSDKQFKGKIKMTTNYNKLQQTTTNYNKLQQKLRVGIVYSRAKQYCTVNPVCAIRRNRTHDHGVKSL